VEVTIRHRDFEGRPARLAVVEDITESGASKSSCEAEDGGGAAGASRTIADNLLTPSSGTPRCSSALLPAGAEARRRAQIIGAARPAAISPSAAGVQSCKQVLRPVLDVNMVVRDMGAFAPV
jgi:hypothetical protein